VQRLKNFGTYICNDRESCLGFDIWSSLEEPMYSLPEVWVRVSGLPSDVITDYLSLWSVGTLFGKTLDVDMAFTRKHKVLRTKIGCLDPRLIPKDSDMFIRRGFFKLSFEVEEANEVHEVNMVEMDKGGDGNDGSDNGDQNKEGGNDMDMDPKGQDDTNNSKNDGQNGASISDGVQGMQLAQSLQEINIGSLKIPLSPTGDFLSAQNSSQNVLFSNVLSSVHFRLEDKDGTDPHVDCASGVSVLGSAVSQGGSGAAGAVGLGVCDANRQTAHRRAGDGHVRSCHSPCC
jgi:hypothetical protein